MATFLSRCPKSIGPAKSTSANCAAACLKSFPELLFYFLPADLVSQILNFGLPAPIDIQIVGRDLQANRQFADRLLQQIKTIPGTTDLRIQQPFNQPMLFINLDRTKAQQAGYSARDIAGNILVSLSGSFQTSPTFWLNPRNGVSYNIAAESPQYDMDSFQDLRNIPIATSGSAPQILASLATLQRGAGTRHRVPLQYRSCHRYLRRGPGHRPRQRLATD